MEKIKKICIGLLAGFICGIFASGGGLILLPAFVHIFKLEEKEARVAAIYCIAPLVLTSFFLYWQNSNIVWKTGILSAIGGLIGGVVGAKLLKHIPNLWLKIFLVILLLYSGFRMIR